MPRYCFDIADAGRFAKHDCGSECADGQDARDGAVGLLPHIARNGLPHESVAAVRSEAGQVVWEAGLTLNGGPGRR